MGLESREQVRNYIASDRYIGDLHNAGDSEQFDVFSRVRHYRIPGGRWIANPLLALGLLWFRLRELL